tara:strand:+ start:643 stop:1254 length:612 start_codon:yes stop_codon:yes gene_type:complete
MEILESGNNSYLSHKVAEKDGHKGFWLGETPCKFSAIQVDFNTLKTGWGFYDGQYNYSWDEVVGAKTPRPSDQHKRAFYLWVMVDGIDDKPLLWNRFTFGEFESLKIMLKQGWNEWQKDKSKLPTYKYTGSEDIKVGMGSTSIAQFDFIGCRPRKDTFVIPSWDTEPLISDGEVKMASEKQDFQKLVNNAENENGLTFDDIPF